MDDGRERTVAYVSRTLSSSERNYAQIEREALAIAFGVKKFDQFSYGRRFYPDNWSQNIVGDFQSW